MALYKLIIKVEFFMYETPIMGFMWSTCVGTQQPYNVIVQKRFKTW